MATRMPQHQGSRPQQQVVEKEDDWEDLDFFEMICKLKRLEDEHERPDPLEDSNAQHLIKQAVFDSHRLVSSSILTRDNAKHQNANIALAEFDLNEIIVGQLLGRGGFARVHKVVGFDPLDTTTHGSEKQFTPQVQAARDFFVEYATRESTGEHRFALKHLKRSLAYEPDKFASAVVDLAMEAHILSVLNHPNILKIRGVAATGPRSLLNGQFDSYFIIVDKLSETLKERMYIWKKRLKRLKGFPRLFHRAKREAKRRSILLEQLQVAFDIASAVEYLHKKGVMHRDIKVSNCGFDTHGTCKLFDFGLAEEIRFDMQGRPCLFNERVGSSKYMAPEVALRQDYDTKADVYSYAMTLHQILSLSSSSQEKRKKITTEEGTCFYEAPTVCRSWPFAIQTMLVRAFSSTSSLRPNMSEIRDVLRREIERVEYEDLSVPFKNGKNAVADRRRSSMSSYSASLIDFMAKHDLLPQEEEEEEEDTAVCTLTTKDTISTLTTRGTSSASYYHDL